MFNRGEQSKPLASLHTSVCYCISIHAFIKCILPSFYGVEEHSREATHSGFTVNYESGTNGESARLFSADLLLPSHTQKCIAETIGTGEPSLSPYRLLIIERSDQGNARVIMVQWRTCITLNFVQLSQIWLISLCLCVLRWFCVRSKHTEQYPNRIENIFMRNPCSDIRLQYLNLNWPKSQACSRRSNWIEREKRHRPSHIGPRTETKQPKMVMKLMKTTLCPKVRNHIAVCDASEKLKINSIRARRRRKIKTFLMSSSLTLAFYESCGS